MGENKSENAKTANQAWRKQPRKFAPKSRLGCKTCKIRRIKCDLSRPSCLKCKSTGRTCDGYGEMPPTCNTEIESNYNQSKKTNRVESCANYQSCITGNAPQPKQWHAKYNDLIWQNLRPLMILPENGSAQTEAMCFFEYMSIRNLNEYHPCESWRKNLMLFSQTVPSVRYAATALALVHRDYLERESGDRGYHSQPLKTRLPEKDPLFHYNRAIQLLLGQELGDNIETTAVTLLVCYLFICFDQLAGNYVQAIKHLRGGLELSRNIEKAIVNNNNTNDHVMQPGVRTLISQVTRQIRRLDMQAVMFLVDWTPADNQDTLMSQLPPSGSTFQSLSQAADHLHVLIARVMGLRNTEQATTLVTNMPPPPSPFKDTVLEQFETWSCLFENLLCQDSYDETDFEADRLISLLRLQHTIAWTFLRSSGPGREMEYDNFLPQFRQCVALAGDVAAAHERYSGSLNPTFTPEIGILPILYIIGVKCRDPVVRRAALSILRRQPIREAVWDSIAAARVVERVIEIEEGNTEESKMTHNMEQIAVWQRMEVISWIQTAGRVDLSYTFCSREGMHIESLMI